MTIDSAALELLQDGTNSLDFLFLTFNYKRVNSVIEASNKKAEMLVCSEQIKLGE
jgi:hypothetical protein